MLIDMTLEKYIRESALGSPTPGGGSVCALAGALGASLTSMVGEITLKKELDKNEKEHMEGLLKKCKILIERLEKGVDADPAVFNKVMDAYHMAKTSDEDKSARSKAIQTSLKEASDLPYQTALLCLDVMNMSIDMLNSGTKSAASDASVAGFLGYAGLNGALYNVKINLKNIKDVDYVNKMKSNVDDLISKSEMLISKLKSLSSDIIG
jgi:formiminotetrahydrofolate cyclodeaminase